MEENVLQGLGSERKNRTERKIEKLIVGEGLKVNIGREKNVNTSFGR